jgi:hypothetical protein
MKEGDIVLTRDEKTRILLASPFNLTKCTRNISYIRCLIDNKIVWLRPVDIKEIIV